VKWNKTIIFVKKLSNLRIKNKIKSKFWRATMINNIDNIIFTAQDPLVFEYQLLMIEKTYWAERGKAYTLYRRAYQIAQQEKNIVAESIAVQSILQYFLSKRNLSDKAEYWVKKAQKLVQSLSAEPIQTAKLLLQLAWSEQIARRFDKALSYLYNAQEVYASIGYIPSQWYITAAIFMYESEEYEKGWKYLFTGEEMLCREWEYLRTATNSSNQEYILRHRLILNTLNVCKSTVSYALRFRDNILAEQYIQYGIQFQELEHYNFDIAPLYGQLANILLPKWF
jgi:hypothetical protein